MSGLVLHITNFDDYLKLINNSMCVIKFTADWCPPCKRMAPIYNTLANDYHDTFKFLEIDIDLASEITNYENVASIPLFLFYRNGVREDHLRLQGSNEAGLKLNVKEFSDSIIRSSGFSPDISFDTLKHIISPIIDEEPLKDVANNVESEPTNDIVIEKTISEDMIKTE